MLTKLTNGSEWVTSNKKNEVWSFIVARESWQPGYDKTYATSVSVSAVYHFRDIKLHISIINDKPVNGVAQRAGGWRTGAPLFRSARNRSKDYKYKDGSSCDFQRSDRLQRHPPMMAAKTKVCGGRDAGSAINCSSSRYKCPGKSFFRFPKI